jgi:hypothetical protein
MILQKTNTVNFDASNPEHRKAVAMFMKRTAWADTSYRFSHDPAFGSVADQVKVKMLHWYIAQDTGIAVQPAPRPLMSRGLSVVS